MPRRPRFRQIADQLREAIRAGRYGEGDALPSETALAETYGVTRMTARQAREGPDPAPQMDAGGQPMQLATSYVPWSLAEGTQMVERDSGPGGIYSRLADVGHGPVRFTEEVATRMPTPEESPVPPAHGPAAGLQPVPDGLRCIRGTGRGVRARYGG